MCSFLPKLFIFIVSAYSGDIKHFYRSSILVARFKLLNHARHIRPTETQVSLVLSLVNTLQGWEDIFKSQAMVSMHDQLKAYY